MRDNPNSPIAPMKCKCAADIYKRKATAARPAAPKETTSLAPAPVYGLMLGEATAGVETAAGAEDEDHPAQVEEAAAGDEEEDHPPQVAVEEALAEELDQLPQVSSAFLVVVVDHEPQVSSAFLVVVVVDQVPHVSAGLVVVVVVVQVPQVSAGVVLAVVVVEEVQPFQSAVVPGAAATKPTAVARAMIEAFILIDWVGMVSS